MKSFLSIVAFLFIFLFSIQAQVGKPISNVKLVDVNDKPQNIPYLGNKVFVLFYVDPDVQEIVDPLSDAINAKKYHKDKFGAIGAVNCKDTWFPNSSILSKARQKQEKFPESLVLLDKGYLLPNLWGLGKCNDAALILLVGKDSKIKYLKIVKSQDECKANIQMVLKSIEEELKK